MVDESHIVRVGLTAAETALADEMAVRATIGGVSHVHADSAHRWRQCPDDNRVGQRGEAALSKLVHGSLDAYVARRRRINEHPEQGDGGCDLDDARVDVKASLMRGRDGVLGYRLAVRHPERHPRTVYVLALVPELRDDGAVVDFIGWMPEEGLTRVLASDAVFAGAYTMHGWQLLPMEPVEGWLYLAREYGRVAGMGRGGCGTDWMQTFTGVRFWPLAPSPEDLRVEDIAHSLSRLCRYNGHCEVFYSVAEHSVVVSRHVPSELASWGLLHDAAEAYVGDVTRPLKRRLPRFREIEDRLLRVVATKWGLAWPMPAEVERVDDAVLADEARHLMGSHGDWDLAEPPLGAGLHCWGPQKAERMFMERWREVCA